ncbi:MAG TPA: methyltransferase domain-containing protein, partial [Roseiflexaceae bacterium]
MGDLDELRGMARAALQMPETRYLRHLRSRLSLHNYQRIADDVVRHPPRGRLLDWGTGFGQMSFLLRRRGLQVIGFDYNPQRRGIAVGTTALDQDVPLVTSDDPVRLPFVDRS